MVPGGFGERGAEGKISAVKFARERHVPYFGICFGMQMAVIEAARNLGGFKGAGSSEFGECEQAVVGLLTEWVKGNEKEERSDKDDLGGTMRLGAYECLLAKNSKVREIYGSEKISERHRHRYEVNIDYRSDLEKAGLNFSGMSPDQKLPEIVEIPNHPWFVGVQFHPELKSKPFDPHPLLQALLRQLYSNLGWSDVRWSLQKIDVGGFTIANDKPFVLIAGPCQIESENHCLFIAEKLAEICSKLNIPFIFKASYDKANRTSVSGQRGVGLEKGIEILAKIKSDYWLPCSY